MQAVGIEALKQVMQQLRDKQHGCPWDLKQTFESLLPYTIEETYEVVDAINGGDRAAMKDELGDLLFQVVFYAQLGEEEGSFDFEAIAQHTADKLIRRHPHVFEQTDGALSDAEIKQQWEAIKQQERKSQQAETVFKDIPSQLPSVLKAAKLQKRAASVGFDWTEEEPIYAKVYEEIDEVRTAENDDHLEEEIGDLLFAVINLARHKQVNPERALQRANNKFVQRFQAIEAMLSARKQAADELSLDQLEALWQEVKSAQK
ncbi:MULTISPECIES: nucleoside triphosphate pyrophosphohydrolase [Idiomarina]|mgnify:CR=1 FL=1|jgi:ATP diphosphatase|uniref:Nucleoside triphosphate pyrophosphohydrolase n=2 Tax=Idiomarina baltica TaxID=190892 RepID=A0A348WLF3_9GAMM|nr:MULTISPECIES: nucleoside triphosphate pyrophosphohydrolase [Idiomarina]EAQ31150.1 Predicted pyrophosphatase MazG [Idiomarina baltica OS145]HAE89390.1 nucleoside triphosphate pyrophosphohydrolase [Idiomarina sp.]HAR55365.1 nucleoside triphosphate pyrophosphohydrolase [Idiomarina baltica]|tara:strand:- start:2735 stop:3514 length:780 start_codon:yes stop_codon:yes gene_type:complete